MWTALRRECGFVCRGGENVDFWGNKKTHSLYYSKRRKRREISILRKKREGTHSRRETSSGCGIKLVLFPKKGTALPSFEKRTGTVFVFGDYVRANHWMRTRDGIIYASLRTAARFEKKGIIHDKMYLIIRKK